MLSNDVVVEDPDDELELDEAEVVAVVTDASVIESEVVRAGG